MLIVSYCPLIPTRRMVKSEFIIILFCVKEGRVKCEFCIRQNTINQKYKQIQSYYRLSLGPEMVYILEVWGFSVLCCRNMYSFSRLSISQCKEKNFIKAYSFQFFGRKQKDGCYKFSKKKI